MGAAYATLVSQTFVNVVYDVLDPRLAELFSAKLKSLNIIRISLFIFIFLRNLLSVPGTK
jgi:F0F1-type ATP synthase membrane subunit a